jgi:hypothetical protein
MIQFKIVQIWKLFRFENCFELKKLQFKNCLNLKMIQNLKSSIFLKIKYLNLLFKSEKREILHKIARNQKLAQNRDVMEKTKIYYWPAAGTKKETAWTCSMNKCVCRQISMAAGDLMLAGHEGGKGEIHHATG